MQDAKTKGESLEFSTPSVEGTIFPLKDGTWEKHATFDSETDAINYLNSLFKTATDTANAGAKKSS